MKNIFLSLLAFTLFIPAYSQLNVWGPPSPFSDSITDNTDATLKEVQYYAGVDHYVFWVRGETSSSSDIVARRYYTQEDPVTVLSDGVHHFRNPQLIPISNWSAPDTLFALFYEADLDGDFDIYYQYYTPLGFTPAAALTENDQDDSGIEVNNAGGIIWENSGTIYYAHLEGTAWSNQIYFDTLMVVDNGSCSNPSLSHNSTGNGTECLSWEKTIAGATGIMVKKVDWGTGNWLENEVISVGENNTRPRFSEGTFSEVPPTLCWNMMVDDSTAMYASDLEDMYYISDFKQIAPFNPHCYNIFIGVDWLWDYSIITFEKEEQADIFGGEWGWYSNLSAFKNISNSAAIDRNPYLTEGYFFGDWEDVINIWESYRNGHWQLWTAMIPVQIWGGVEEPGRSNAFNLKAVPNPFGQEVKLSFDVMEAASCRVSVMSIDGKILHNEELGERSPGHHEVPLKVSGSLPSGVYIAILEAHGMSQGIRLVKQ
jgi:hypothetical protein